MWPISPTYLEAIRHSHVMTAFIDVYNVDAFGIAIRVLRDVPIVDGSVTCSRKSTARRTLDAEIVLEYPNDGRTALVNSSNTRVQVWKGMEFSGRTERVPIGVFRIDSVSQTNMGSLRLTGSSLEVMVADDRFISPYTPTYNTLATEEIAGLIQESVPYSVVRSRVTSDYKVRKTTPWARERWDAIQDMADAIVADVYCGADGIFVIEDQPDLLQAPIVWVVDEGEDGVLVELDTTDSRQGVYNAVVASGQSTDTGISAITAAAYDLDPSSPTYWDGGFGHVPKFYSSQFLYTYEQALAVAEGQLSEFRGLNKTLTFSAIPNPALEPGDAVMVAMLDGTYEKHILQGFNIPLGDGSWTADTVATEAEDEGDTEDSAGTDALPAMADFLSQNRIMQAHESRIPKLGTQ